MMEVTLEELNSQITANLDHSECGESCSHLEQIRSLAEVIHGSQLQDEVTVDVTYCLLAMVLLPMSKKDTMLRALIEISVAKGIVIGYQTAVKHSLANLEEK